MVRIILADDHPLVTDGLKKVLESDPTYRCVGTVEDGRSLVHEAQRLKPDLALIDVSMPRLNGLDAGRSLKRTMPSVKLVFLTMHDERRYVTEAFRAGASAYLLKHGSSEELFSALREVLKGRLYLTPLIAGDFPKEALHHHRETDHSSFGLTPRQREILQLVAEGNTNKAIAKTLHISVKTVEFHKTHIGHALGIHTTAELTRYACAQGLVPSPSLVADTAPRHIGQINGRRPRRRRATKGPNDASTSSAHGDEQEVRAHLSQANGSI